MGFWYVAGNNLGRFMMRTFGRVDVVGRENVPPVSPLIIAPNHQSNVDPPLLTGAFHRQLWFMGKRGLFANPVVAYFLRGFHVYPVDRDGKDLDAIRWCIGMLSKGEVLVVFPEGTRYPGTLGEGETNGAVYLALRGKAPILPVAITGTEHLRGFHRIAFPLRRLRVVIGQPYWLPDVEGRLSREVLNSLTRDLMHHIALLLPPQYRGVYGEVAPPGQ